MKSGIETTHTQTSSDTTKHVGTFDNRRAEVFASQKYWTSSLLFYLVLRGGNAHHQTVFYLHGMCDQDFFPTCNRSIACIHVVQFNQQCQSCRRGQRLEVRLSLDVPGIEIVVDLEMWRVQGPLFPRQTGKREVIPRWGTPKREVHQQ